MRKLTSLAFMLLVASCMGDGGLSLQGRIVAPKKVGTDRCILSLPEFKGGRLEGYYSEEIDDNFHVEFLVEPKSREYLVKIECQGRGVAFMRVQYAAQDVIDLGEIRLNP